MDEKVHAMDPPMRRKLKLSDFWYPRSPNINDAAMRVSAESSVFAGIFGSFLVPGGGFMVSVIFCVIGGVGFLGCR